MTTQINDKDKFDQLRHYHKIVHEGFYSIWKAVSAEAGKDERVLYFLMDAYLLFLIAEMTIGISGDPKQRIKDRALYSLKAYAGKDIEPHKKEIIQELLTCCLSDAVQTDGLTKIPTSEIRITTSEITNFEYVYLLGYRPQIPEAIAKDSQKVKKALKILFLGAGKKIKGQLHNHSFQQ